MTRQFYWRRILNYKAQFSPGPKGAFRMEDPVRCALMRAARSNPIRSRQFGLLAHRDSAKNAVPLEETRHLRKTKSNKDSTSMRILTYSDLHRIWLGLDIAGRC
jgi:hypothetical protein